MVLKKSIFLQKDKKQDEITQKWGQFHFILSIENCDAIKKVCVCVCERVAKEAGFFKHRLETRILEDTVEKSIL